MILKIIFFLVVRFTLSVPSRTNSCQRRLSESKQLTISGWLPASTASFETVKRDNQMYCGQYSFWGRYLLICRAFFFPAKGAMGRRLFLSISWWQLEARRIPQQTHFKQPKTAEIAYNKDRTIYRLLVFPAGVTNNIIFFSGPLTPLFS